MKVTDTPTVRGFTDETSIVESPGTKSITASYSGDASFTTSAARLAQTVN